MFIKKGFPSAEILVTIGIISLILIVVGIAFYPVRQASQKNNTIRLSDMAGILDAVYGYASDHEGVFPPGISSAPQEISTSGSNLCHSLVTDYLEFLPRDPLLKGGSNITKEECVTGYATGYRISLNTATGQLVVSAPHAELGASLSLTR